MKTFITKKQIAASGCHVYSIPYAKAQTLLTYETPKYYYSNAYGWRFDAYYFYPGIIITTGYGPIGEQIDPDLIKKYEVAALKLCEKHANIDKFNALVNAFFGELEDYREESLASGNYAVEVRYYDHRGNESEPGDDSMPYGPLYVWSEALETYTLAKSHALEELRQQRRYSTRYDHATVTLHRVEQSYKNGCDYVPVYSKNIKL